MSSTAAADPPRAASIAASLPLWAARSLRILAVAAAGAAAGSLTAGWSTDARMVAAVFTTAVAAWTLTRLDDTLVALCAILCLVVVGATPVDTLLTSLGDPTIWLLIGACMLAAGVSASGLTERLAVLLIARARSVRGLAHLVAVALLLTAFAVPATSGRAALALPVHRALAERMPASLQRALSLLFPTVILLSAVASLLGAGAHLIAAQLIAASTGVEIGFLLWAALGLPVAIVTSHLAVEAILLGHLDREDRGFDVTPIARELRAQHGRRHGTRMRWAELRALITLAIVVGLWLSEPSHGVDAAVVALLGGVAVMLPGWGSVAPKEAMAAVPWSLLLFLAATLAMGAAIIDSGAADALASTAIGALRGASPGLVLIAIVAASAIAHLLVQSRSARATVLLPPVMALAAAAGLSPVIAALASTAAAGFCLTLTASAKPVAMFAQLDDLTTFDRSDLLRLSGTLALPVIAVVVLAAAFLWPALGIPLTHTNGG
ncbi:SLC13 family permease [Agrococcus sp. ARC_14]|uniref:SLC13 family permease n=1 Tax=Agrococcus sp. ARC_14 TaxID=2919927 RepID=UPI001F064B5C|nr:SLC13 family permease [Agrococcus sp. ARC_14]MCH1882796.1 anion permease [Agrococcus sp. ARC_14]